MLTDFLPTTKKEVELRKWNELDVILFSADAYIDHPAFGAAVIGRTLEAAGYQSVDGDVTMRAQNETELSGEDAVKMQKLIDALEDLDDVQDVYTSAILDLA